MAPAGLRRGREDKGGPAELAAERRRMAEILRILKRAYPDTELSLRFETPFQLLVSAMLAAQCTDERVNLVTPALFARFPGPDELARARVPEVERLIRSINFYRTKARALVETSRALVERHGGEVPGTIEDLVALRGVGRKTANVVLGRIYGVPGLVVDTHVGRLARRMGFTRETDPARVERDLMRLVPRRDWTELAGWFISHGRETCTARRAFCERCPVARLCPKVGAGRPVPEATRGEP